MLAFSFVTQNNNDRNYEAGPRFEFAELGQGRAGWRVVPEDREHHPALRDITVAGGSDQVVLEEGETAQSVLGERYGLDELTHPD